MRPRGKQQTVCAQQTVRVQQTGREQLAAREQKAGAPPKNHWPTGAGHDQPATGS